MGTRDLTYTTPRVRYTRYIEEKYVPETITMHRGSIESRTT